MESQETTPEHAVPNGKPHSETLTPPYWQFHRRQFSHASVASNTSNAGRPPPIILEDHTEELEGQKSPLWAKSVSIDNHVVVAGNITGIGNYVVWICKVFTLDVGALLLLTDLLFQCCLSETQEVILLFGRVADVYTGRLDEHKKKVGTNEAASWVLLTRL